MFLLSFFWPPPFRMSLSLSLLFFSFFLLSCLSVMLCFGSLFLSPFLSVFFAFVSWKEQHQIIKLQSLLSILSLCFWYSVLFSHWSPFSYRCFFPDFKLCFFSTSMFWVSKQTSWKTPICGQEGVATKHFFMNLCFGKCEKLSYLLPFGGKCWLMFKKHCKNRYFSTFSKAKKANNDHF